MRRANSSASRLEYGRDSIGAISSSRCTNEEVFLVQKLVRTGFGNNNIDTCARVCHSPTGYGLSQDLRHFGRHAGLQVGRQVRRDPCHRRQSDRRPSRLRLAPEEAAARGRPADRRRSAPHRSRPQPACRGRPSSAAAARHQRRRLERARACRRHRGPRSTRRSCASAATRPISNPGRASSPRSDIRRRRPRRPQASTRRNCGGRAALCDRRQRGDLLRSRRHRARAGLDRGDGDRQSRHGDRQHRPRRRRREPAARTEQRAGLLRHGLVPARVLRLPSRFGRRDAGDLRAPVGRAAQQRAGPAHPQHDGRGDRRRVQGPLPAGRGHRPVRSRHEAHHGGPARDGMRDRAGPLPQRDRALRPCFPPRRVVPREGRHLHQRRTAHQPGAQGDRAARRQGRLGGDDRARQRAWACRCTTSIRARSWTRSPRRRRPSAAFPMRGSTSSARSNGPATTRRRTARRSCMSSASCAARGSSC